MPGSSWAALSSRSLAPAEPRRPEPPPLAGRVGASRLPLAVSAALAGGPAWPALPLGAGLDFLTSRGKGRGPKVAWVTGVPSAVRTGPCGSGVHWASGQHHAVGRTRVHGGWSRATGRSSRQESRMRVGEGGLSSAVPPRHVGLGIPGGRRHLAQGLSVAGTWGRSSGGWTDERVNE